MRVQHFDDLDDYVRSTPHSRREDLFRYFDLAIEIRYNILGFLPARGTVALRRDVAVKQRLRYWDHERPEWALLSAVSRQTQRDASDVVYSAKNTIFVPLGSIDDDGWWCIPRPFPQVKRLDIAFDMQDITENIAYTLQCVKYRQDGPDGTSRRTLFEELTNAERWDLLHEKNKEGLTFDIWSSKISACIGIDGLAPRFHKLAVSGRLLSYGPYSAGVPGW
ncbi:hypothetical protein HO133_001900 [Letharia lupina]|uniref:Uncharacterized protein n=1 Tax=Letharia lupina TaxID=560253 RepID=A0A8H6FB36_9LECA|nr:uncharacterized protein HO133_001900 [Letharia lupina]KAF6221932.1 hypothetical protein HO133_001900 [Letharia lupina]